MVTEKQKYTTEAGFPHTDKFEGFHLGKYMTGKSRQHKSKRGWYVIAGRRIYFRSSWEVRFAKYMQFLKEHGQITEWLFEPQTFWFHEIKRGTCSYLPDFKVTRPDGSHYWVEVKGYMDAKSKTKIKRFRKYYPDEELQVVESKWFENQARFTRREVSVCGSSSQITLST